MLSISTVEVHNIGSCDEYLRWTTACNLTTNFTLHHSIFYNNWFNLNWVGKIVVHAGQLILNYHQLTDLVHEKSSQQMQIKEYLKGMVYILHHHISSGLVLVAMVALVPLLKWTTFHHNSLDGFNLIFERGVFGHLVFYTQRIGHPFSSE